MPSSYGHIFNSSLALLRHRCPVPAPVRVRTVPTRRMGYLTSKYRDCYESNLGLCVWHEEGGDLCRFEIFIVRGLGIELAVDTLIHEWSHCLDVLQNGAPRASDHRNSWGANYARCYRALYDRDP